MRGTSELVNDERSVLTPWNQYVLAHCDRLVIGNLNPDGMLNFILSESDPDKEIVYL